jgi:hypothetical protein
MAVYLLYQLYVKLHMMPSGWKPLSLPTSPETPTWQSLQTIDK